MRINLYGINAGNLILSLSKDEAAALADTDQSSRAPPETLSASPVT
jgi:hypothetical protein